MIKKSKSFWSKPIAIIAYLYEISEPETGLIVTTYKKIQDATDSTAPTVAKTMKRLQEDGTIEKVQRGIWRLNDESQSLGY